MKGASLVVFFVLCGLAYCLPQEKYTTKYDNVDLDAIIRSDRLLRNYLDCVLSKRACTKDGAELKSKYYKLISCIHLLLHYPLEHLPEALNNHCAKCSEAQKNGSRKIIHHLIKNKRSWWDELERKFDPTRSYRARYADELRREGIIL
ncbi:hypothetical protein ABEB36_009512 [Hypothenemus hampei]|uniref:Uncharacterized protein n=1 Tax=Hypothenemus hampei TaxID=57062 RepID=A0ABD1EGU2_HYPHA